MTPTPIRLFILILCLLSLALTVSAQDSDEFVLPDAVTFEAPAGLQPEGVVWDESGERFIVGSLLDGRVGTVDDEGVYAPLFTDEQFVATTGLHLSDGVLYVANTSPSAFIPFSRGLAGLVAYDLESETVLYSVDLTDLHTGGGARFANDVTVDADGNAYVTDSFQPVIYQVTPDGEASVLVESELLDAPFLGSNGIDYHPDGFLLVAVSGTQTLVRIHLDSPEDLSAVAWDVPASIDGMVLAPDGALYAVARLDIDGEEVQVAARYVSEDGWETATLDGMVETASGEATTLTLRGEAVYYINAYLQGFGRTEYEITRAVLE